MLLRGLESAPARVHRERLSVMLALPSETLRATLTRKAPLRALGLVDYDGREVDLEDHLRPSRLLCELLDAAPGDGDALLGLLIEPAPPPAWRLEDFPHLARERAQLCEVLAEAACSGSTGVNALLYGAPGTGKTALAGLLAEALDRELVSRRASDLLSPYVGETEQQLAELFQQGDPSQQVLLLDEVDSFLSDRRRAQHSWERVQVNELLQQMEAYPGIFIAATNLMAGIDPAALRRFDLKLGFLALSEAQRIRLFAREVFGAAEAPVPASLQRYLQRLDGLTPGDFANVCRQQQLQGAPLSPEQFLRRLAAEWQLKGESTARAA